MVRITSHLQQLKSNKVSCVSYRNCEDEMKKSNHYRYQFSDLKFHLMKFSQHSLTTKGEKTLTRRTKTCFYRCVYMSISYICFLTYGICNQMLFHIWYQKLRKSIPVHILITKCFFKGNCCKNHAIWSMSLGLKMDHMRVKNGALS